MTDPIKLAEEIEAIDRIASPAPWTLIRREPGELDGQRYESEGPCLVMSPDCEDHPVADTSSNHTCRSGADSQANAALVAMLRNHAALVAAALRLAEAKFILSYHEDNEPIRHNDIGVWMLWSEERDVLIAQHADAEAAYRAAREGR